MKIKHCRTAALLPKVGLFILKFEHILIERIAGIVEERTGKDRTQPGYLTAESGLAQEVNEVEARSIL